MDPSEAAFSMNGLSGSTAILAANESGISYSYLSDMTAPESADFWATTFAVSTNCSTLSCPYNDATASQTELNCGPNLTFAWKFTPDGLVFNSSAPSIMTTPPQELPMALGWYTDSNLSAPYDLIAGSAQDGGQYLSIKVDSNFRDRLYVAALTVNDFTSQFNTSLDDSYVHELYLHSCEVSLFLINYTRLDRDTWLSRPVPASAGIYAALVAATRNVYDSPRLRWSAGSMIYEMSHLMAPNMSQSTGTSDFALQKMASLTQTALRESVAAFLTLLTKPAPSLGEQTREKKLLTRVPKQPLWALVSSCVLSSLLGFGVSCWAVAYHSQANRAIKKCVTVQGVIGDWFRDKGQDVRLLENEGQQPLRLGIEAVYHRRDR